MIGRVNWQGNRPVQRIDHDGGEDIIEQDGPRRQNRGECVYMYDAKSILDDEGKPVGKILLIIEGPKLTGDADCTAHGNSTSSFLTHCSHPDSHTNIS